MALKFVWVFYSVGPNYHGKVKMVCEHFWLCTCVIMDLVTQF